MRRLASQEEGFALVFALLVCVVLTISTISIVTYTSSSSRSAGISTSRASAYDVAEAGMNAAMSEIAHATNVAQADLLGCTISGSNSVAPCTDHTATLGGGTASYHGTYVSGSPSGTWTITSTGDVRNPAGGSDLKKTVTATVQVTPGGQVNNISIWNYVVSDAPPGSGCEVNVSGQNVVVDVPLYVLGDLCISGNNAGIAQNGSKGQLIDVMVGGRTVISGNNAFIGTSSQYIYSGVSNLGCSSSITGSLHSCTTADSWYVTHPEAFQSITAPTTDYPGHYQSASPGPKNACSTSLTNAAFPGYPVLASTSFDNNTTMDGTNTAFNLTPGSNYACVTSGGTLAWNAGTHLLTVNGTIFFDGNVTSSDTSAMYHGKATIYANGKLTFTGQNPTLRAGCPGSPSTPTHQCAFTTSTTTEWDPNKDMLILVTNLASGTAVDLSGNNIQYQGGLECTTTSTADLSGNNVQVEGPIICGKYTWGNNTDLTPLPAISASSVPSGAPNWPAQVGTPTMTGGG